MNWRKILAYGAYLFVAQWTIGMADGYLFPGNRALFSFSAGDAASLIVSAAIFAHLAIRQYVRPLSHAFLALLICCAASYALGTALSSVLGSVPFLVVALGWLSFLVAMLAGVSIGNVFRRRPTVQT
jgi:hypothetical protein